MNYIHEKAEVQSKSVGARTYIWQYTVVLPRAIIGNDCNINCHCFIENDVIIGDRVTVKSGVYIWDGLRIEDDVFIGPNVTFANDVYPRSKVKPERFETTILERNCSIGAGATILPGIKIGAYSLVGAGSLVTKDVPERSIVYGSPAVVTGSIE